jgi:uncharacterized protein with NRDE domain
MCICFFFVGTEDSPYRFVLIGNRDEFFSRASAPMHSWPERPRILAGRDLVRGGSWWGFAKGNKPGAFKFSVVHNFRHAGVLVPDAKSRGELPINFLKGDLHAHEYAYGIEADGYAYNGFTLIVADEEGTYFVSNRPRLVRRLDPGYYALSNASLDTPWPKLLEGKETFTRLLESHMEQPELTESQLSHVLVDAVLRITTVHVEALPKILDPDREIALSSIFVKPYEWDDSGHYGTRTHSLLFVRHDGSAFVAEHNLDTKEAQSKTYLERDEGKQNLIPDYDRVVEASKILKAGTASGHESIRGKWQVREFQVLPFDSLARL